MGAWLDVWFHRGLSAANALLSETERLTSNRWNMNVLLASDQKLYPRNERRPSISSEASSHPETPPQYDSHPMPTLVMVRVHTPAIILRTNHRALPCKVHVDGRKTCCQ